MVSWQCEHRRPVCSRGAWATVRPGLSGHAGYDNIKQRFLLCSYIRPPTVVYWARGKRVPRVYPEQRWPCTANCRGNRCRVPHRRLTPTNDTNSYYYCRRSGLFAVGRMLWEYTCHVLPFVTGATAAVCPEPSGQTNSFNERHRFRLFSRIRSC